MKNSIELVRFSDDYLSDIYDVYGDQEQRLNVLPKKSYITREQFEANFKRHIEFKYTEFKIIKDDSNKFIGFVIAYEYLPDDGHMKVSVYVKPEFQHGAYGLIAVVKFVDYLFKFYNLNKLFTEVYDFNTPSIKLHDTFGFTKEGHLKEYKYYNGEYHDMLIYAVTRETFYGKIKGLHLL